MICNLRNNFPNNPQALIDVIEALNWTHIQVMVDDLWSEQKLHELLRAAGQHRICIVKVFKLVNTLNNIKAAVIGTMNETAKGR